jgi:hypothetical protein
MRLTASRRQNVFKRKARQQHVHPRATCDQPHADITVGIRHPLPTQAVYRPSYVEE